MGGCGEKLGFFVLTIRVGGISRRVRRKISKPEVLFELRAMSFRVLFLFWFHIF